MLPVTILTGFLGCGKTTLLRRILESPGGLRLGILMNEKGLAGIDDARPVAGGFVELAEGCVCCIDQPDLVAALFALESRGDLDRIILETTGLADPLPITWTISRPEFADRFLVDAVITVVDVANQAQTQCEEWEAQVRSADVVILSKLDLAGEGAAEEARRAVLLLSPHARIATGEEAVFAFLGPSTNAATDGAAAAASASPRTEPPLARATADAIERPRARHGDWSTLSFSSAAAATSYDADALEDLVEDLPESVFRAKGIAHVASGRWFAFQAVGGRVHVDLEAAAPAHGESRLVFFGRNLHRAALEARLADCLKKRD